MFNMYVQTHFKENELRSKLDRKQEKTQQEAKRMLMREGRTGQDVND